MSWRDALGLARRSLLRRRGRTGLTISAVALAAGLLVALLSIAQTADTRIIGELGRGGPATAINVVAAQPDPFQPDADNPKPGTARDLSAGVVQRIRRMPDVSAVIPVLSMRMLVIPLPPLPRQVPVTIRGDGQPGLPDPFVDNLVGVDLTRINSLPVTLLAGRLPATGSTTEVAVTQGYLDRLHLPATELTAVLGSELELASPQIQPPGSAVHIRGRRTRALIVGLVAQQVAGGQLLTSIGETERSRQWALGGVNDKDYPLPTSQYSGLLVLASTLDRVHTVRQGITLLGYSTSAPEHLVTSVQKYLHVVDIVLGAIGLVALVIAALGIADALLTAVRERRQEIATLKAIGARDRDVVRWFLVEALVIGALGGVIGTLVGLVVAYGVGLSVNNYLLTQGLHGVDLGGVPASIIVAGLAGCCVLSVLAGALPVLQASRLPAYEALGGAT